MDMYHIIGINKIYSILPNLVIGACIFIAFWILGLIIKKIILRLSTNKTSQNAYVYNLIGQILKVTIRIIGTISALGTIGINVSALIGSLGLTGFALGFAMKDMISNILSGLLILLYKPIGIGDNIKIDKFNGFVSDINLRYTVLKDASEIILVPNSKVFSSVVCIRTEEQAL